MSFVGLILSLEMKVKGEFSWKHLDGRMAAINQAKVYLERIMRRGSFHTYDLLPLMNILFLLLRLYFVSALIFFLF